MTLATFNIACSVGLQGTRLATATTTKNCDDVDYLLIWFSDLVVADGSVGDGRKHRGNRVLITNQVAQELVED